MQISCDCRVASDITTQCVEGENTYRRESSPRTQITFPAAAHRTTAVATDRNENAHQQVCEPTWGTVRKAVAVGARLSSAREMASVVRAPPVATACVRSIRMHRASRSGRRTGTTLPRCYRAQMSRSRYSDIGCCHVSAFIFPLVQCCLLAPLLFVAKTFSQPGSEDGRDRGARDQQEWKDEASIVRHEWVPFKKPNVSAVLMLRAA